MAEKDKQDQPAAQPAPVILDATAFRARMANEAALEAARLHLDETQDGGRYRVGDRWLDANGNEIT